MPPTTDELRILIRDAGGLVTAAGLATRWHISKPRAYQLSRRDDFPEPLVHIDGKPDRPVWAAADVDEWRATPRRPGRPAG